MPDERSSDLPGGSDDPTRAGDPVDPTRVHEPVDPTRVHEPVDTSLAQGAAPAAGMGRTGRDERPFSQDAVRRPPGRDDDSRTSTWLWALLAVLLIGIVIFALLQSGDDDDAVGTVDPTTDTAAPEAPVEDTVADTTAPEDTAPEETDTTTEAVAETTTTAAPEASEGAEAGAIATADGTDLLSLVQGDAGDAERLAPYAGEDVTATSVEVLEVVDGQGIWVGTDDRRLFVASTDDLAVGAGDAVALEGVLQANDGEIELTDEQGAEVLEQQGHHIELDQLTPA